jgi:dolichyl-phosphate beta-glucosyltransferase
MTPIDLSIIIPAYMEAAMIVDSLTTLADWLDTHDYGTVEVIVVVANSSDGTAKLAESQAHRFKHFRVTKPGPRVGKGRDVRAGLLEATGRYRLFMDADLATPLKHLDDVAAGMQQGDDIIIAVRNLWQIHSEKRRKLISTFGNIVAQVVVLPGIKDTQCGFKAFRSDVCEAILPLQTMLGWSFDVELLVIARRLGYHVTCFDAPDWHDPKEAYTGLSGDSPMSAAFKTFRDLFIIRFNVWRGRYPKPKSNAR